MHLPVSLQRELDRALHAVIQHPDHALEPFYRLQIYQYFGSMSAPTNLRRHVWRDILAVRHVLPIWKANWTESLVEYDAWTGEDVFYFDPEHAIQLAERVIIGQASPDEAEDLHRQGFEEISFTGEVANSPLFNTHCIREAALHVLATCGGSLAFETSGITVDTTDDYLTFRYGDAAFFAAIGVAGRILPGEHLRPETQRINIYNLDNGDWFDDPWREQLYDPSADSQKRRSFWTWWITEAIPQAWWLGNE
jgi:hypothetical protein